MRYFWLLLFCALLAFSPVWGGRTFNGTSDTASFSRWLTNTIAVDPVAFMFKLNETTYPTTGNFQAIVKTKADGVHTNLALLWGFGNIDSCTFGSNNYLLIDVNNPGVVETQVAFQAPATGLHTYVINMHGATPASDKAWVDGVAQTVTVCATGNAGPPISQLNLNAAFFGSSGSSTQFLNGTLSDFAYFYNIDLTLTDAIQFSKCVPPGRTASGMYINYFPFYGTDSPEPAYPGTTSISSGNLSYSATLTGTTRSNVQAGCQPNGAYAP